MKKNKSQLLHNMGKMLKRSRKQAGLTESELAERVNVSQQQISRYENGVNCITFDKLIVILNALDMNKNDICYFFENIKLLLDGIDAIECNETKIG